MITPEKRRKLLILAIVLTVAAGILLIVGAVVRNFGVLVVAIGLAFVARTIAWQWARAGHRRPPPPEKRIL
ncbi:MAG TPA: hypothetical protein VFW71_11535 [Actinomycetota bacterium]|nr:hypothetical protein [Actinomycetota bacterium]